MPEFNTGNYREELEYLQQALVIQREIDNRAGEVGALTRIARVEHQQSLPRGTLA